MQCPHCNSEIDGDTSLCPVCHGNLKINMLDLSGVKNIAKEVKKDDDYEIFDENEVFIEKKEKNDFVFLVMIILSIIGIISIIAILIFYLIKPKTDIIEVSTTTKAANENSENVGVSSSYSNPGNLNEKMLATFYDSSNKKYSIVDLVVNRKIEGEELSNLVSNYGGDATIVDGNEWFGYEYTVYFNDLNYLTDNISPEIDTSAYDLVGNDFYTISGEKKLKFYSKNIYDGEKISNKQSATLKAIYYLPNVDLSICFGERSKLMACIKK